MLQRTDEGPAGLLRPPAAVRDAGVRRFADVRPWHTEYLVVGAGVRAGWPR